MGNDDQRENEKCERIVLLYACSGGSNAAEAADRAAREATSEGLGMMFCLAGLGAGVPGMLQIARNADLNVVIDGCTMNCAKKIFDACGVNNYVQVKVADLGIEKVTGARADDDQVGKVLQAVRKVLNGG